MLRVHLETEAAPAERVARIQSHEHALIEHLLELSVPTVAQVDGVATGDGANLAMACDVPVTSERAHMGWLHVRFGLSMDSGCSYLLPRTVGRNVATELGYTGCVLDADEALDFGIVARVHPTASF